MIFLRRDDEIAKIRASGRIVAETLDRLEEMIRPGVTTLELDQAVEAHIRGEGGVPSFKGYRGYPASCCISIDSEVVHGIPREDRVLEEGQIVGVDVGCYKEGYHADAARTYPVGEVPDAMRRLLRVTLEALREGIRQAVPGNRVGHISWAIQRWAESHGYSVVRDLVGHGVGAELHEEPQVPNYGRPEEGPTLRPGMVLAIEPMVNQGGYEVVTLEDGWTIVTKDGSSSAHFEHTIVIGADGPEVLTLSPRFSTLDEEVNRIRAEARTRIG
jgi:methionyl aminopeptidase